jgi:hypothetical protein
MRSAHKTQPAKFLLDPIPRGVSFSKNFPRIGSDARRDGHRPARDRVIARSSKSLEFMRVCTIASHAHAIDDADRHPAPRDAPTRQKIFANCCPRDRGAARRAIDRDEIFPSRIDDRSSHRASSRACAERRAARHSRDAGTPPPMSRPRRDRIRIIAPDDRPHEFSSRPGNCRVAPDFATRGEMDAIGRSRAVPPPSANVVAPVQTTRCRYKRSANDGRVLQQGPRARHARRASHDALQRDGKTTKHEFVSMHRDIVVNQSRWAIGARIRKGPVVTTGPCPRAIEKIKPAPGAWPGHARPGASSGAPRR